MQMYEQYSNILRLKILILKNGVKFEPLSLFNDYQGIDSYKIKRRIVHPEIINGQVYNISKDNCLSERGDSKCLQPYYQEYSAFL